MTVLDIVAMAGGSAALIPLVKALKAFIRRHFSVDTDIHVRLSWPKTLKPVDEAKAKR